MQRGMIGFVYGMCPVQAEGVIGGHRWYFRSRYSSWAFRINKKGKSLYDVEPFKWGGWHCRKKTCDHQFCAGYMPKRTANRIIKQCLKDWVKKNV